jgi:hypothetical protein
VNLLEDPGPKDKTTKTQRVLDQEEN